MTSFHRSTSRRLQKLTRIPSIWEGDRRPLSPTQNQRLDLEGKGECILWVDGSEGVIRGMDVVSSESGPEAVVRTLMRAMETPQSPGLPGRPQKIVVRDREIQFYLRGVLQDLDICIDYAPELPLIDELFRSFSDVVENQTPDLPPQYFNLLHEKASQLWHAAPWEFLEEQQIIAIEINQWDIGTLYASVMGMLGMEYGILLYRSEESLKRFRATVLTEEESHESLEEAFLKQDCLFVTFDTEDEDEDEDDFYPDLTELSPTEIKPTFGNIHPLEGLRSILYEEEALIVLVALEAFSRFLEDYHTELSQYTFSDSSQSYRINLPELQAGTKSLLVKVSTMPKLATELESITGFLVEEEEDDESQILPMFNSSLRDDLIPADSFLSLGVVSWEMLGNLRESVKHHQGADFEQAGEGLPVILVQTSRPKAKIIIEKIEQAKGLRGICFNPGADPDDGDRYDLGLLQTHNSELFLFGEFVDNDPTHAEAREKWNKRCKNTKGYCGLIIARGLTGAARGNPQLKDMMALFETRFLTPKDLGLGTFQLVKT
ncbi:MAG: hypothetical protein AAF378_02455 [Cyanobacteria bacterium P01_A01_bin.84]